MSGDANMNTDTEIMMLNIPLIKNAVFVPLRMRSYFFAPKFCATKVEYAFPKSCTGRYEKVSIFTAAANAAITTEPKLFTSP